MIDQFGYHITSCKKDANAIRLHDNVVHIIMALLRLLGFSVALEPMNFFSERITVDLTFSFVTLMAAVNR